MEASPSPVGTEHSAPHRTRSPETTGVVTARIVEYHPNTTTGLGEPAETAHARVEYESEDGRHTRTTYVQIVSVAPRLRRVGSSSEKTWVREAWANEADEDEELLQRRGAGSRHVQIFQFSTPDDLRWDDLLEEVVDNAEYLRWAG